MPTDSPTISDQPVPQVSARGDRIFRRLAVASALLIPLLMGGIFIALLQQSWPAIKRFGFGFLVSNTVEPGYRTIRGR